MGNKRKRWDQQPGLFIELETIESMSVWDMIEEANWSDVKAWADVHRDQMNTKGCRYSIINSVVNSLLKSQLGDLGSDDQAVDPIQLCLDNGADINEEDEAS